MPLPIAVFRGDAWQCIIHQPELSIRIALYIRSSIKALDESNTDTRVAIGIGRIDHIPEFRATGGDGEAFVLSGIGLDSLGRQSRMAIGLSGSIHASSHALSQAAIVLLDDMIGRWTVRQSAAVASALTGAAQQEIAAHWQPRPVTQQAIAQHLNSAGWGALHLALKSMEAGFHGMLGRSGDHA